MSTSIKKTKTIAVTALSALALLLLTVGCSDDNPANNGGNGTHTAGTPDVSWYTSNPSASSFTISTADELAGLAQLVNDSAVTFEGKTVTLAANVSLSAYGAGHNGGKGWTPIGYGEVTDEGDYVGKMFKGVFDGGGKTVSGLYISGISAPVGLFGFVDGGTIKNLGVTNAQVTAGDTLLVGVGIVAGRVVGGGSISGSYSTGAVSGADFVGGVAGVVNGGTISDSYSTGAVSGADFVGGVAGTIVYGARIERCYSTSNVSGAVVVGGVAGAVYDEGTILTNSYSTGAVTGTGWVGGVAGAVADGSRVEDCYSLSDVSGMENVGGAIGAIWDASAARCYSTGAVSGMSFHIGGVVGGVQPAPASLSNSAALNPFINAPASDSMEIGRVAACVDGDDYSGDGIISGNVAFVGLTVIGGGSFRGENTEDGLGGADITLAEILADGTLGGRFTSATGWTVVAGKLPGLLGAAVDMPAHLTTP